MAEQKRVIWLDRLRMSDIEQVGGKNASLGEMIAQLGAEGVRVPGGFATTAAAFREFLAETGLHERVAKALSGLDVDDVAKLARVGAEIRLHRANAGLGREFAADDVDRPPASDAEQSDGGAYERKILRGQTRKPVTPRTRSLSSSTALRSCAGPMLTVPAGAGSPPPLTTARSRLLS